MAVTRLLRPRPCHLCVQLGRHAGHAHGTTTLPSTMAGTPPASANVAHRKQTLTGANVLHGLAWPPKVERGARLADYDHRGTPSAYCRASA